MSTAPQQTDPPNQDPLPIDLVLKCWPVWDEPRRGWILLAGQIVMTTIVWSVTGDIALAFVASIALAVAMWRDLLPITYSLGTGGISQQIQLAPGWSVRRRRIDWTTVGRCEILSRGVVASPHKEGSAVDRMCGVFLPFAGHREEVIQMIARYATQAEIC